MKQVLIILTAFAFNSCLSYGNNNTDTVKKPDADQIARENINKLKNGVLLVRLHRKQATIDALRKNGNIKEADIIEREQRHRNMSITNAFRTNFTFCPVYFFYNTESEKIKEPDMQVLDFNLKPMEISFLNNKTFLIAEIGPLYEQVNQTGSNNKDNVNNREVFKNAIIILDTNFNYILKPFPYYVRVPDMVKVNKRIKVLDQNLTEFYKLK